MRIQILDENIKIAQEIKKQTAEIARLINEITKLREELMRRGTAEKQRVGMNSSNNSSGVNAPLNELSDCPVPTIMLAYKFNTISNFYDRILGTAG